ncbi:hypothetical protein TYRP_019212 [Tyrophagus putrescentiae]|nr:hypothetical protein TYRP_019212 [Tyrophagus putrescentiae]
MTFRCNFCADFLQPIPFGFSPELQLLLDVVSTLSGQWAELSPLTLGGGRAAEHEDSNSRSSGINVDRPNRSATDCLS